MSVLDGLKIPSDACLGRTRSAMRIGRLLQFIKEMERKGRPPESFAGHVEELKRRLKKRYTPTSKAERKKVGVVVRVGAPVRVRRG